MKKQLCGLLKLQLFKMKHTVVTTLEKFKEGQRLYNTSPLFNTCLHYLAAGGDIYHILETVISMHEEQIKLTQEIIERGNAPIYIKYDTDK